MLLLLAPAFHCVHRDVKAGDTPTTGSPAGGAPASPPFVGVEIPLCLMRDAQKGVMSHAVALRRYGVTLRESVYAQLLWGCTPWGPDGSGRRGSPPVPVLPPHRTAHPLPGADDPMKLKSIRPERGYIKYAWYEEADEFEGEEKVRAVNQSLMRGGEDFAFFYTFNPPRSARNWCNQYVRGTTPGPWCTGPTTARCPGPGWESPSCWRPSTCAWPIPRPTPGNTWGGDGHRRRGVFQRDAADHLRGEIGRFDHIRRGLD
ncbi:MAG: phage terminase large subunit [Intestinimonas sp.]